MKNFLKGIIAGIGNIVPGLSGSAFLIIFNLYEKCIEAISNIFKDFKKSIIFLFPIGLGILVGTYIFSNIIFFFINKFPMGTYIIFTGFILGTFPHLFYKATKKGYKPSYLIPFFITFSIGLFLLFVKNNNINNININNINFLSLILIGFLISISTIIPGISTTVILNLFNFYNTYIETISTLNIKLLIPILIGLITGFLILSKILTNLFKKYYSYTFFAILGFTISTVATLIPQKIIINIEFFISIIVGIICFFITYSSMNKD